MKDRPLTNEEAARIILATSTDQLSLRWARAVLGEKAEGEFRLEPPEDLSECPEAGQ